jgi:hypothetical protein
VQYRVVDLRADFADAFDIVIDGVSSPEEAGRQALGIQVTRSGHRRDLVANVYFQLLGKPVTMVRLYSSPPALS